MVGKSKD